MPSRKDPPFTIVVDTREQQPWTFESRLVCSQMGGPLPRVRATLDTGDYSVLGAEHLVRIERKSLADFVGSVAGKDAEGRPTRERFFRELERLQAYPIRAVIVEAKLDEAMIGAYRSNALPQSVVGSALAISADFSIPVLWPGDVETAEYCAAWLLRRAWQRHLREQRAAEIAAAGGA